MNHYLQLEYSMGAKAKLAIPNGTVRLLTLSDSKMVGDK